jgi:hypothetical protein
MLIHGGPHAMDNVGFKFGYREHAANGRDALHEPAREHRLRQQVRQRHQERLSEQGPTT